MWELLGTIVLGLAKIIFEKIAKNKLSDAEFVQHIEAHQERKKGAGRAATDFEDSINEAIDSADADKIEKGED